MNEAQAESLNQVYRTFESGDRARALDSLRDLARGLDDPLEKAALLYHEALFLLEMDDVVKARQRLEEMKTTMARLGGPVSDGYEDDLTHNLAVMAAYTELRVLIEEGHEREALELLENLVYCYPKQLSITGFREIVQDIDVLHGFLLADVGRWSEAWPLLENARAPEKWKSVLHYYRGHCFYQFREYRQAQRELRLALDMDLEPRFEAKARYVLGVVEYHLSDMAAAKAQFDLCLLNADSDYLKSTRIWEWLEATSLALGLPDEAARYRQIRAREPSRPN